MKKAFLFLFLVISTSLFSQSYISGFIPIDDVQKNKKEINLIEVRNDLSNTNESLKVLESVSIDDKGFFHFRKEVTSYPKFYYLSVNGEGKVFRSKRFLLSNNDSIFFQKSEPPLSQYISNSVSDREWQKYLIYKNRIKKKNKFLDEIRAYSKDSLQILAVKLMSIKELEKKKLLDQDIALNKEYYTSFLDELKESDINPQEYLFLELKMTQLRIVRTEEDYATSKWLNYILIGFILGLLFLFYKFKNSKQSFSSLSKQELAIKNLILEEKSNKEIAAELFISVSTVKTHITSIYQKLQVINRNDLITKFKNSTGTSP